MTSNPDVPPFIGYVETTVHALRLIHAARQGVIPRITRRLNDSERRSMIKSGAVFVFSVEESGIKRWTDGLLWSPSRIVGNFLVYREINERSLVRTHSPEHIAGGFRGQASSSDQGTFKPNGLIKKTITVTVEGSDLHLISYYTSEDIRSGKLKKPSSRPDIMALHMPPHIFRLTNFRVPPKIEMGPDGKPRLVCEAEDPEPLDSCKLEDHPQSIPTSPPWGPNTSPISPVDNPFSPGNSLYHLQHGHGVGTSDVYGRGSTSNLGTHTSRHELVMVSQGDTQWSSFPSQRWNSPNQSGSGYSERSGRIRSSHPYDDSPAIARRDKVEGISPTFPHRYPSHLVGRRDSVSHRLQPWHPREASDDSKERRASPHTGTSFNTSSPTLPFSPQTFQPNHSYGTPGWSSNEGNTISSPTLHPLSSQVTFDMAFPGAGGSRSISSPEEYTDPEDFGDS
ncbi:Gti1/Pac2 family-domain-containing protein [Cyathus striatus]|nr:Gti1/Pac2 family-domain-containing protein [Cyathus striatus]